MSNKVAIITGASRGIGLAIAKELGVDGYKIVILARGSEASYEKQFSWFREHNIEFLYIQADVSDTKIHQQIIEEVVAHFGGIHVLVNNAGVAPSVRNDLLDMTEESYDYIMHVNTRSAMFLTQKVAKQMISQSRKEDERKGVIINITSISSFTASILRGEYCVSKAGLSMLTSLYASRLAKDHILVHEVQPGIISTDMTKDVKQKYDKLISSGEFPLARWGTPEDVAKAVSLLCSPKIRYSTGEVLHVDGGFHLRQL